MSTVLNSFLMFSKNFGSPRRFSADNDMIAFDPSFIDKKYCKVEIKGPGKVCDI